MTALDWIVLILYLAGMIGLSALLSRGQKNAADYYVGGRNLPWWAVGVSTMATQTSATSFVSIPAFVALAAGGGLTWLQYELAVPLAMIFVMVILLPFFRRLELISVYEYLELRFDAATRRLMSAIFLMSRGLATGAILYVSGLVLSVCLGLPVWACILIVGVVTIIYDTLGGMAAVVYSDVIQMVVLLGGVVLCTAVALAEAGGFSAAVATFPAERLEGIDLSHGLGDGASMPFWGLLLGGFFFYAAYYGVDQSQVQRELSAPSTADTKRALLLNGFARFPLTLSYMILGIAVGAASFAAPELRWSVASQNIDQLIPEFILAFLPIGVTGLLFAAIFSAAMSSVDSALNSLSASTLRDFIEPRLPAHDPETPRRLLAAGKLVTVFWGIAIAGFALAMGRVADTVIEAINLIGSVFYGPILAAFLTGILDRRAQGPGVRAGVAAGVAVNVLLATAALTDGIPLLGDVDVFWMWWNLIGVAVGALVTTLASRLGARPSEDALARATLRGKEIAREERGWLGSYIALLLYFLVVLGLTWQSGSLLGLLT